MSAYYNEIDLHAAQWLRNLIAAGHIAPGVVDTRSIEDVQPDDLRGFTQCHFFAGIGVWSYALRRAGWADNRPVWTGSCPCQPFSAAGQGAGFDDERHLWPAFHHLIKECKPAVVLGEQVASKDADPWIDLVHTDLEAMGYAFGAVPFPSAGVGAPHIRDRNYWAAVSGDRREVVSDRNAQQLADANNARLEGRRLSAKCAAQLAAGAGCMAGRLADAMREGSLPRAHAGIHRGEKGAGARNGESQRPGAVGWMADTNQQHGDTGRCGAGDVSREQRHAGELSGLECEILRPSPTNGFWRDADWLGCRDGKWRPVEPGTFPLAHGAPARVGRLRAYGNAINAEAAIAWIECVMGAA